MTSYLVEKMFNNKLKRPETTKLVNNEWQLKRYKAQYVVNESSGILVTCFFLGVIRVCAFITVQTKKENIKVQYHPQEWAGGG
jgi:hypothetical protein